MFMLVGNDVSYAQGSIDWDTYKNNSNFVIIRSTYGNGYYDNWFAHNRDESRRVGLPRGFYHYCYPQYNLAQDEADWFCKALYDLQQGEILALDFEEHYTGDVVTWCKTFLDRVSQNFNGIKPVIYLNQSLVASYNWQPVIDAGYGLWLAAYLQDGQGNTGKWPFMALQQTSSSQSVPGITGAVDRDVFFGDASSFQKYGYHVQSVQESQVTPVEVPIPVTTSSDPSTPSSGTSANLPTTVNIPVTTSQTTNSIPPQNKPSLLGYLIAILKFLWTGKRG